MCGIIAMGPQPRRRSIKYSGRGSVPTALSLQMWLDTIATLGWSARSDGSADFLNQCWLFEPEASEPTQHLLRTVREKDNTQHQPRNRRRGAVIAGV